MEGANYCYEIEMTSNYLLAAYNLWCKHISSHYPPTSHTHLSIPICLFLVVVMRNDFRQVRNITFFIYMCDIEAEKMEVVKH